MFNIILNVRKIPLLLILVLSIFVSVKVIGQLSSNNKIQKDVLDAAGSPSSSINFELDDAVGQPSAIGVAASANYSLSSGFFADLGVITAVESEDMSIFAETFELSQNYPNPFNPSTTIHYSVPQKYSDGLRIKLIIFSTNGQVIRSFTEEHKTLGSHTIVWDGTNESGELVSTGLYFYTVYMGDFKATRKMIFMK